MSVGSRHKNKRLKLTYCISWYIIQLLGRKKIFEKKKKKKLYGILRFCSHARARGDLQYLCQTMLVEVTFLKVLILLSRQLVLNSCRTPNQWWAPCSAINRKPGTFPCQTKQKHKFSNEENIYLMDPLWK